MRRVIVLIITFCVCLVIDLSGQHFSTKDSIRGGLSPERTCYDVTHYELALDFKFEDRSIKGSNIISFDLLKQSDLLQVDLFETMDVDSIIWNSKALSYFRKFDGIFIDISPLKALQSHQIEIFYNGTPRIARNAPWDGGFVWSEDGFGNPWVAVACEGLGASVWWPNKDHLSDEPDSMKMTFTVPQAFSCISNGQLINVDSVSTLSLIHI